MANANIFVAAVDFGMEIFSLTGAHPSSPEPKVTALMPAYLKRIVSLKAFLRLMLGVSPMIF